MAIDPPGRNGEAGACWRRRPEEALDRQAGGPHPRRTSRRGGRGGKEGGSSPRTRKELYNEARRSDLPGLQDGKAVRSFSVPWS